MDTEMPVNKFSAFTSRDIQRHRGKCPTGSVLDLDGLDGWKSEPKKAQSSATVLEGARWHKAYCLIVRVTCNIGPMATKEDLEVPPHSWSEGIARDMIEYHLGLPSRTITVELLNNSVPLMRARRIWLIPESSGTVAIWSG